MALHLKDYSKLYQDHLILKNKLCKVSWKDGSVFRDNCSRKE